MNDQKVAYYDNSVNLSILKSWDLESADSYDVALCLVIFLYQTRANTTASVLSRPIRSKDAVPRGHRAPEEALQRDPPAAGIRSVFGIFGHRKHQ